VILRLYLQNFWPVLLSGVVALGLSATAGASGMPRVATRPLTIFAADSHIVRGDRAMTSCSAPPQFSGISLLGFRLIGGISAAIFAGSFDANGGQGEAHVDDPWGNHWGIRTFGDGQETFDFTSFGFGSGQFVAGTTYTLVFSITTDCGTTTQPIVVTWETGTLAGPTLPAPPPTNPVVPPPPAPAGPYVSASASRLWCTDLTNSFCSSPIAQVPRNTSVTMVCWRDGSSFTGIYTSPRWFYVRTPSGGEGFVHSSYVQHQIVVPNCSALPWMKATDWALALDGQAKYAGLCLGFMADAYRAAGKPIPGPYGADVSAASWWAAQGAANKHTSGTPPRGALVFWGARKGYPDGHVALSLGNGWVISSSERTTTVIHTLPISARSPTVYNYLGWWMAQ
jgi:hypothetical protein